MKSKTILIAYQDDLWARSLSTFFHGLGYRVEMAQIGERYDSKGSKREDPCHTP